MPAFCSAFISRIPVPPRPKRSDTAILAAKATAYSRLADQGLYSDLKHWSEWIRSLPGNSSFFDPLVEVFDGTFTPLQFSTQSLEGHKNDLWSYKFIYHTLKNSIGVDATGFIATACCGRAAKTADLSIMADCDFYKAMSGDPSVYSEEGMLVGYRIVVDSGFCQLFWSFATFTGNWVRIGPNRLVCRIYNFRLGQLQ